MRKRTNKYFTWDHLVSTILVFVLLLTLPVLMSFDIFEPFRNTFKDLEITDIGFSKIRDSEFVMADTNIVIINSAKINNADLIYLLSEVLNGSPKVIGLERILKNGNRELDQILAQIIQENDNIILTEELVNYNPKRKSFDTAIQNSEIYRNKGRTGFNNLFIDKDKEISTLREFSPIARIKERTDTLFSVKIAEKFNSHKVKKLFNRNNANETIYYRANFEKFFYIDGLDLIKGESNINLKNKIVLIGKAEHHGESFILDNLYFTPLNPEYAGRTFPDMYGIVVHANIISMILNENYYSSIPSIFILLITFMLTYFNMFFYETINNWKKELFEIISLIIFVVESLLILVISYKLYHDFNFELDLTIALFATVLSGFAFEGWRYSFKPITINLYYKLFKRR
jgi:CHASE2 domain-containing sensor protein